MAVDPSKAGVKLTAEGLIDLVVDLGFSRKKLEKQITIEDETQTVAEWLKQRRRLFEVTAKHKDIEELTSLGKKYGLDHDTARGLARELVPTVDQETALADVVKGLIDEAMHKVQESEQNLGGFFDEKKEYNKFKLFEAEDRLLKFRKSVQNDYLINNKLNVDTCPHWFQYVVEYLGLQKEGFVSGAFNNPKDEATSVLENRVTTTMKKLKFYPARRYKKGKNTTALTEEDFVSRVNDIIEMRAYCLVMVRDLNSWIDEGFEFFGQVAQIMLFMYELERTLHMKLLEFMDPTGLQSLIFMNYRQQEPSDWITMIPSHPELPIEEKEQWTAKDGIVSRSNADSTDIRSFLLSFMLPYVAGLQSEILTKLSEVVSGGYIQIIDLDTIENLEHHAYRKFDKKRYPFYSKDLIFAKFTILVQVLAANIRMITQVIESAFENVCKLTKQEQLLTPRDKYERVTTRDDELHMVFWEYKEITIAPFLRLHIKNHAIPEDKFNKYGKSFIDNDSGTTSSLSISSETQKCYVGRWYEFPIMGTGIFAEVMTVVSLSTQNQTLLNLLENIESSLRKGK